MAVLFDPHPKQLEFLEAVFSGQHSFILFGGAIRGGKTYALLGTFILLCRAYPGSRHVIIRKDLPRIKRNLLPVFNQICPESFIKEKPTQYNEWTATFTNGSQILFFAENIDKDPDLDRFKGLEFDCCGIEEMDVQEATFKKAFERMGSWKMADRKASREKGLDTCPSMVMGTCNPSQGWVKSAIYDKWKENKLPEKWLYIPSKVYDNPYIEREWIEDKRKNMDTLNFQRFVEGDWEVNMNEQPFFYEFDRNKHIAKAPTKIDPFEPLWLSFDFNIDPTTCVIGQKIPGKGLFIHKLHQVKGGTAALCQELKIYRDMLVYVTGDRSGTSAHTAAGMIGGEFNTDYRIIAEMLNIPKSHLIDVHTANKMHTYSRSLCNTVFYRLPITISPECEELIKDLEIAQPDKNGRLVKDRNEHKQDAGDAFRYLINAWFQKGMKDVNLFENLLL